MCWPRNWVVRRLKTNWPERFHHLQMKCMTPSVAASQPSRRGALARGLHVDVILPIETRPQKNNIVHDRVEPLSGLRRSAEPSFLSGTCHNGESRSRSGTLERPGGVTGGDGGEAGLRRGGYAVRQMVCVKGASAPVPGFPSVVFTSWQRGRALLTRAVRWVRR